MAYLPLDTRNRWFNILWNENLQKVHIKAGDIHVFINLKTGVITIQWGGGGEGRQGGKHRQVGERVTGSGSHGPSVLPSQPLLVMEPTQIKKISIKFLYRIAILRLQNAVDLVTPIENP